MLAPAPSAGERLRRAAGLYLLLATAGVTWIAVQRGGIPAALFLPGQPRWLDPLVGTAAASALLLLWQAVRTASPLGRVLERRLRHRLGPLQQRESYALALLSGIAEEVFFRGALQSAVGIAVATVLFAALHSGRDRAMLLWALAALVAGAVLGGLVLWRGTLFGAIVCHVMVNAVQLRRLLAAPATAADGAAAPPSAG